MAGPARTMLDAGRHKTIVDAFRNGATIRIAAGKARIHPKTLAAWLQTGREDLAAHEDGETDELTAKARLALDAGEAIADRDLRWLGKLEGRIDLNGVEWTRMAWLLERTSPDEFALREVRRHELTAAAGEKQQGGATPVVQILNVLAGAGALPEGFHAAPAVAGGTRPAVADGRPRQALPAAGDVLAEPS